MSEKYRIEWLCKSCDPPCWKGVHSFKTLEKARAHLAAIQNIGMYGLTRKDKFRFVKVTSEIIEA